MTIHPKKFLSFCLFLCTLALPAVRAEEIYVGTMEVRIEGAMPISRAAVLNHIKLREGMPFRQELNDESIRALYATHLFDYVEVTTDQKTQGDRIDVTYVLYCKQPLKNLTFQGNRAISARKLRKEMKAQAGMPLDQAQIQKDAQTLADLYRSRGYLNATVNPVIAPCESTGMANATFEIVEGKRQPIARIIFRGNEAIGASTLRKMMQSRKRSWYSFLDKSGYYRPQIFEEDLERLRHYYRDQGFLDVQITKDEVEIAASGSKFITITIAVHEGPRFHVGQITFEGNDLVQSKKLETLLKIRSGDFFSPSLLDEGEQAIRYFYGQSGYMETYAKAERHPQVAEGLMDITFVVHESERSHVGLIHVHGNTKTRNDVILRELSLLPGGTFDLIRMRNSENRLRETRYFETVTLTPEDTLNTNSHDLLASVEEGKTGRFNIGGAIASLDNIVSFIELSQSNFDLFNRKSWFEGGGQKFRTRLELGTRSSQGIISFEEPWLFERELALGTEIFHTRNEYKKSDHNYNGATYDERHSGFEVSLRKRIIESLEGRWYYRLDRAKIYNVGKGAAEPLREDAERGSQWISKTGIRLQRDTTDSLLYPTQGSRVVLDTDYAGVGGDVHSLNLDVQAGKWYTLDSKIKRQTIGMIAKMGSIKPFDGESLLYFDRKFLGGPHDMRGFELHGVGPKDGKGEPLGAQTYFYGCSEYSYKIAEPLRAVWFMEGAFMGQRHLQLNSPFYMDTGIEFRVFVMGSPLRLIFGYPLRGDAHYDHHLQFNFSFGSIF